jgi:uncharacterized protein (DUF302 family)
MTTTTTSPPDTQFTTKPPQATIHPSSTGFGIVIELPGVTYADAVAKTTDGLKKEGFGVLTTIDVKKTMKEKIDVDFRPYTILGACNPHLAHKALSAESDIGLLLPCNVTVEESTPGSSRVTIVDPLKMLSIVDVGNEKDKQKGETAVSAAAALKEVSVTANEKLNRVSLHIAGMDGNGKM